MGMDGWYMKDKHFTYLLAVNSLSNTFPVKDAPSAPYDITMDWNLDVQGLFVPGKRH